MTWASVAREKTFERIPIRPEASWADKRVKLIANAEVVAVDPSVRQVALKVGGAIGALLMSQVFAERPACGRRMFGGRANAEPRFAGALAGDDHVGRLAFAAQVSAPRMEPDLTHAMDRFPGSAPSPVPPSIKSRLMATLKAAAPSRLRQFFL